jgi:pimeloyl-ACP methyl ester carboxylesterase
MIRGIRAPTLLISGEVDRLVPVAAARSAAADNPDWETLFLPGVGHTPQLEAPGLVIDAVTDWIAGHPTLAPR